MVNSGNPFIFLNISLNYGILYCHFLIPPELISVIHFLIKAGRVMKFRENNILMNSCWAKVQKARAPLNHPNSTCI